MKLPQEIRPSMKVSVDKSVHDPEIVSVSSKLDFEGFVAILNREMNRSGVVEGALEKIEDKLLGDRVFSQMDNSELFQLYEMFLKRKEITQRFVIRLLDMGVKCSFIERLLKGEDEESPASKPIERDSKALSSVKLLLQKELDERSKSK